MIRNEDRASLGIIENKLLVLCIILFCFCFGYLSYSIKYLLLAIPLILMITFFLSKRKLTVTRYEIYYTLFIGFSFTSLFWSNSFDLTNIFIWTVAFILSKYFYDNPAVLMMFSKLVYIACGIHLFGVVVQLFAPSIIYIIDSTYMDAAALAFNQRLYYGSRACAGFTEQTGSAAFFISILLGLAFIKLVVNKKRKWLHVIIGFVSFIGLVLTQKRALFVFNGIAMFLIYVIYKKISIRKIIMLIRNTLIAVVLLYVLLKYTTFGGIFVNKFIGGSYGDIFSNRQNIYTLFLSAVGEHLFLGHGLGSTGQLLSLVGESQGHSIYLQILYEVGAIGLFFFLEFACRAFIMTWRGIKKIHDTAVLELLLMSLYIQIIVILWGFTGNPLYDHYIWFIYLSYVAVAGALKGISCFKEI